MSKKAILLANLGSPDSYKVKDVKTYLDEFLMDERVIDIPYLIRFLLVKGIIVPFRSPQSAKKYKTIWTEKGSPLIYTTKELTELVAVESGMPAYMCMRYANPTPKFAMNKAVEENPDLEEIIMVPLYPHYAMSSYETAVEHVKKIHTDLKYDFKLKIVSPYYNHESYLESLANSIKPFLKQDYDHLLFSYHGVPERHIKKSDITNNHCLKCKDCCNTPSPAQEFCYRHQVKETTDLVAKKLQIPEEKYSFAFQSRLGSDKWLKPYTAATLEEFPKKEIKKLLVVCPAFVSDCLETLEEIQDEGKETFLKAGGKYYEMIPCLNIRPEWVKSIHKLVNEV